MNKNNYCVIMAGGVGSRFWPLSKTKKPKQFLDILNVGKSFLQMTFERFGKICPTENIYIVTNLLYTELVAEQLPEIKKENILSEPYRRNTAPCIAYANYVIGKKNPDANIIVAPSDHLILDEPKFIEIINEGLKFVSTQNGLLTLGITPSRPETGYGYIQADTSQKTSFSSIQKVASFTEKPELKIAEQFVKTGEFFWNSGIFLWSLKSINKAFDLHLPTISNLFKSETELSGDREQLFINNAYSECKNISIDNGVMEYAENVFVFCTDFGWSDLGTWNSLYENSKQDENLNVISSDNIMTYETKNSIINVPNDKLVVVQGLEDFIVAESDNTLLICKRDNEGTLRKYVNDVKILKGEKYV